MPRSEQKMTEDLAVALMAEHGSYRAAARASGVARTTIQKHHLRAIGTPLRSSRKKNMGVEMASIVAPHASPGEAPKGRALDEFRARYDKDYIVPRRIKAGLESLGAGWEYEVQFARMAGISLADLAAYRDQFAGHCVALGRDSRRAWAGTVKTATEMRSML